MQVIVYSMGANEAFSILPINCLYITQISLNLTGQQYCDTLLPERPSATVALCCYCCEQPKIQPELPICNFNVSLFQISNQNCLWINTITLHYSNLYKNKQIYISIFSKRISLHANSYIRIEKLTSALSLANTFYQVSVPCKWIDND